MSRRPAILIAMLRLSTHATRPRGLAQIVMLAVASVSCQGVEEQKAEPTTGALRFEVPAGVTVRLDGELVSGALVEELQPGSHEVEIASPCGDPVKVSATVEKGKTADVQVEPPIPAATVRIDVSTPDGMADNPRVTIRETVIAPFSDVQVVACPGRLKVEADGWGGFMEDLDLEAGKRYEREIELARGPDLVRIHGGPFTLGPPEGPLLEWYPDHPRKKVEIETFDIERHEVTAFQFHTCYIAGGCIEDRTLWGGTVKVRPNFIHMCSSDPFDSLRAPVFGREDHPVNCVADWEAEQYCRWAGKRLPTAAEWEYAARSRKEAYSCPWGPAEETIACPNPSPKNLLWKRDETSPVCLDVEGISEQGVCSLMWNVAEYVTTEDGGLGALGFGLRGGTSNVAYADYFREPKMQQKAWNGFRCVRSVKSASTRKDP